MSRKRKFEVTLLYKNGYAKIIQCDECSITRATTGGLSSIATVNSIPEILLYGVNEIAAVFSQEN